MSDDAFYKPNYRVPPRVSRPGEPLWSLHKGGRTWSAELRDHGAGVGVETQILCDGELVTGRRFDLRELATRWGRAGTAGHRAWVPELAVETGWVAKTMAIGHRPRLFSLHRLAQKALHLVRSAAWP